MNKLIIFSLGFFLSGCASTKLSDSQYKEFAFYGQTTEICHKNGHFSDQLFMDIIGALRYNLSTYSFDEDKLSDINNQASQFLATQSLGKKECSGLKTKMLMTIQSSKEDKENKKSQVDAWNNAAKTMKENAPKTTFCNQTGTMTTCTTN